MTKNTQFVIATAIATIALVIAMIPSTKASKDQDSVILTEHNVLNLSDQVDGESVGAVLRDAKKLKPSSVLVRNGNKEPIYLFLNTPGGSIQSGLELIEALKGIDRPVNTVTLFAASMGFQIAQNLGERLIVKNGQLMSHRARGGVQGEFGGQSPSQLESRIEFWKTRINEMDKTTVARTNGKQTLQSYQASYVPELWMTGEQSVERGYADRVVTVKCDDSLNGVTTHSVNFFGMEVQYDLDKCPINTSPSNICMKIDTTRGQMVASDFIAKGGVFGAACLVSNDPNKLCAMDTTLNTNKLNELKVQFVSKYNQNLRNVVYMTVE